MYNLNGSYMGLKIWNLFTIVHFNLYFLLLVIIHFKIVYLCYIHPTLDIQTIIFTDQEKKIV